MHRLNNITSEMVMMYTPYGDNFPVPIRYEIKFGPIGILDAIHTAGDAICGEGI